MITLPAASVSSCAFPSVSPRLRILHSCLELLGLYSRGAWRAASLRGVSFFGISSTARCQLRVSGMQVCPAVLQFQSASCNLQRSERCKNKVQSWAVFIPAKAAGSERNVLKEPASSALWGVSFDESPPHLIIRDCGGPHRLRVGCHPDHMSQDLLICSTSEQKSTAVFKTNQQAFSRDARKPTITQGNL